MRKKKTVEHSFYLKLYRWNRTFDKYSLDISISVSHLTETRKARISKNLKKIDSFLASLTIDDCFDIINLYKKLTRMLFSKEELKSCEKVEIYLLYFSKQQATDDDPSQICRTETKSRIVTKYGLLKELCLYEPKLEELYHVWFNGNWLWKTSVYQIKYSHQNNEKKLIYDNENNKPDNPFVIENYVQPTIDKMFSCIDKFI